MNRILAFLGFLFLCPTWLFGQDVQYSQYYANPLYLNPASTGSTGLYRFGVNFRNQWPGLERTFVAYTGYFDFYEPRIKSSFGVIVQGSNESSTQTSINELGLIYAYRLEFSDSMMFASIMSCHRVKAWTLPASTFRIFPVDLADRSEDRK